MLSFFIFRLNTVLYKEISKKFKKQSLKNGIGMGYIRYCKIKIKNFKKSWKKVLTKRQNSRIIKHVPLRERKNLREIESKKFSKFGTTDLEN